MLTYIYTPCGYLLFSTYSTATETFACVSKSNLQSSSQSELQNLGVGIATSLTTPAHCSSWRHVTTAEDSFRPLSFSFPLHLSCSLLIPSVDRALLSLASLRPIRIRKLECLLRKRR